MTSIHRELRLGAAGSVLLVFAVAGILLDRGARSTLEDELDRGLADKVSVLASSVEWSPKGLELGIAELDLSEFEAGPTPSYLGLTQPDGTRILELGDGAGLTLELPGEIPVGKAIPVQVSGRPMRAMALRFVPREDVLDPDEIREQEALAFMDAAHRHAGGDDEEDDDEGAEGDPGLVPGWTPEGRVPLTLVLARDHARIDRVLAGLRLRLLVVGGVAAVVLGLVLGVVVRRGLRPLDALAVAIERRTGEALSERVTLDAVPREIAPVVDRLNQLLSRVEVAVERERALTADVAHELRTPLAGLRTTLEVERAAGAPGPVLGDLLDIVDGMQSMVERLLVLSRIEAGEVEVVPAPVRVDHLVRGVWAGLAPVAADRELEVSVELEPCTCEGDEVLLRSVVQNLLENLVAHADVGGTGRVRLGGGRLEVANTGSRVAAGDVEGLFERFVRGDPARGGTGQHAGLGLSLVRQAGRVLGLDVSITSEPGGWFVAVVTFTGCR